MNQHQKDFTAGVIKNLKELFKLIDEPVAIQKMAFRIAQVDAHAYGDNGMDESEAADLILSCAKIEVAAGTGPDEIVGEALS